MINSPKKWNKQTNIPMQLMIWCNNPDNYLIPCFSSSSFGKEYAIDHTILIFLVWLCIELPKHPFASILDKTCKKITLYALLFKNKIKIPTIWARVQLAFQNLRMKVSIKEKVANVTYHYIKILLSVSFVMLIIQYNLITHQPLKSQK